MIRYNDYMTNIEISNFYHPFLLCRQDSKVMRFMCEGVKYECIGMPFGLAPAPRLATKLFTPVMRYLRNQSLRVSMYISDLIILECSIQQPIAHTQLAVDTIHYLGFSVNPNKCNLALVRSQEFLSTQMNSSRMQFRVPWQKPHSIRQEVQSVFEPNAQHLLTVRHLAILIGKPHAFRGAVVSAAVVSAQLHCSGSITC